MNIDDKISEIVFACLERLNQERLPDNKIPVAIETLLLSEGGSVDSMELVSLVVDVETAIQESFGYAISLTDDEAMFREESPFQSVANLLAYIREVLGNCGKPNSTS